MDIKSFSQYSALVDTLLSDSTLKEINKLRELGMPTCASDLETKRDILSGFDSIEKRVAALISWDCKNTILTNSMLAVELVNNGFLVKSLNDGDRYEVYYEGAFLLTLCKK